MRGGGAVSKRSGERICAERVLMAVNNWLLIQPNSGCLSSRSDPISNYSRDKGR